MQDACGQGMDPAEDGEGAVLVEVRDVELKLVVIVVDGVRLSQG